MEIYTIGGFNEVGKNMTCVNVKDDAVLFDCGLYLPAVIELQEQELEQKTYSEKKLRSIGALPDDLILDKSKIRQNVRAILLGHAHLDHIGAIPNISYRYKAPVIGTPFTLGVLKKILDDNNYKIPNQIKSVNPNSSVIINGKKKFTAEFVNITHSTLQTSMIALHTPEGTILYANDFKLDNNPVMGLPPNYDALKKIAKQGVRALVVDSLYSGSERKTPSEKVAKALLEEVLVTTQNDKSAIFVTTFSSHIARLKSIVEYAKKINRDVYFVGRSLGKYVSASIDINMCPFKNDIYVASYRKQVESVLRKISKQRTKSLIVCTGHQGEPGSIMERLSKNQLPFKFQSGDNVIFSSKTIPTPVNIANKEVMDKRLKKMGVRIFDNVHVSVLPNTEVIFNDSNGMKIKEIGKINEEEKKEIKVPSFDSSDLKIKWYNAEVIEHPYKGKIFNIKTKSGRSVSITSGHSLFKLEKGKVISEIGNNLKNGDYLAIPKRFSWYKEIDEVNIEDYIDLNNNHYHKENNLLYFDKILISPLKIKLTNEFARLLGYYLAEGSAPRHLSLVINKTEEDMLKEIKNSIEKIFPSKVHIIDKGTSYEITFGARTLKNLFKFWFGEKAKTKKIPKFIFSANEGFKLNFLGAYINGDGCIDKGKKHFRIRIKTASKKLASDLLYLFSQIGICAKFDHLEKVPKRKIANSKKETGETYSYVIRVQGANSLTILRDFLSDKFKIQIEDNLRMRRNLIQQLPPESLPIDRLELDEIEAKKGTYLYDIKNYNENCKKKKKHISPELIKNQSIQINGFTNKLLNGDLLFDPIVKIDTSDYEGSVYDFKVPGAENFMGGFGGIMLHNSGHAGREDLRDLLSIINPEKIIPAHGTIQQLTPMVELAREMGYRPGKEIHLMQDGQKLKL